jgi:hypothetical protein
MPNLKTPDLKFVALVVAGLSFVAVILVVVIRLLGPTPEAPSELPARFEELAGSGDPDVELYRRLALPPARDTVLNLRFEPTRDPRERWAPAESDEFWVDPGPIVRDYLLEQARSAVEAMLEDVP